MTLDWIEQVTSGPGAAEVDRLVSARFGEPELLGELTALRKRFPRDVASAIVETALLRLRASAKFPEASRMLFDRDGLEQATAFGVSEYRAARIAELAPERVFDLGCGIGGDAIALTACSPVIGVDIDPDRVRMAAHNCATVGGDHPFHPVVGDSMTIQPFASAFVFADPARRAGGRRLRGLDAYLPPVGALIERWRPHAGAMAVKVAPGVPDEEIPDDAAAEWISLSGALREAVLWFGGAAVPGERRATVLPSGATITGPEPDGIAVAPIGRWLHEPDDAVVRAGLVRCVAAETGAAMIDPSIAYLTSDSPVDHPMVTSHRIDEVMPFNLKALRSRLAELDVGVVTIKKRGSPITPEELRPRLKLEGHRTATIILTRTADGPLVAVSL